jgi:hypothetical protein
MWKNNTPHHFILFDLLNCIASENAPPPATHDCLSYEVGKNMRNREQKEDRGAKKLMGNTGGGKMGKVT